MEIIANQIYKLFLISEYSKDENEKEKKTIQQTSDKTFNQISNID